MDKTGSFIYLRRESKYLGYSAAFEVFLDDKKVGEIKNGGVLRIPVHPGTYKISIQYKPFIGIKSMIPPGVEIIRVQPESVLHLACTVDFAYNANLSKFVIKQEDGQPFTSRYPEDDTQEVTLTPPNIQLVKEDNVIDRIEILSEEEIPIDNRNGQNTVTMEHEISKTVMNTVQISSGRDINLRAEASLFPFLKTEISNQISKQINSSIETSVTKRQKFTFNAGPGQFMIYVVIWKRRVRQGDYIVKVDGKYLTVPYQAFYDLLCEVRAK